MRIHSQQKLDARACAGSVNWASTQGVHVENTCPFTLQISSSSRKVFPAASAMSTEFQSGERTPPQIRQGTLEIGHKFVESGSFGELLGSEHAKTSRQQTPNSGQISTIYSFDILNILILRTPPLCLTRQARAPCTPQGQGQSGHVFPPTGRDSRGSFGTFARHTIIIPQHITIPICDALHEPNIQSKLNNVETQAKSKAHQSVEQNQAIVQEHSKRSVPMSSRQPSNHRTAHARAFRVPGNQILCILAANHRFVNTLKLWSQTLFVQLLLFAHC